MYIWCWICSSKKNPLLSSKMVQISMVWKIGKYIFVFSSEIRQTEGGWPSQKQAGNSGWRSGSYWASCWWTKREATERTREEKKSKTMKSHPLESESCKYYWSLNRLNVFFFVLKLHSALVDDLFCTFYCLILVLIVNMQYTLFIDINSLLFIFVHSFKPKTKWLKKLHSTITIVIKKYCNEKYFCNWVVHVLIYLFIYFCVYNIDLVVYIPISIFIFCVKVLWGCNHLIMH